MRPLHELSDGIATWNGSHGWKRNFRLTRDWLSYASLQWEAASGAVALARTAGGMVTIERGAFSSPKVTLRDAATSRQLGVFEAGWLEGGRLRLCSGREWRWHMDARSMSRWSFRDSGGRPVLQLFVQSMGLTPSGSIAIEPDAAELPELALLVVLGWYLVVQTIDDSALLVAASG